MKVGLLTGSVFFLLFPSGIYACTRCFGMGVESAVTHGISMAMLGLLVMLGIVWGGIGMFFYRVKQRSEQRQPGEWKVNERGEIETFDE